MRTVVAAMLTALLFGIPGGAQSPSELLQKGIYTQETVGDLDGAIKIFRQLAAPASSNKTIAAQAQYQLVLCMLRRGDRAGAAKEVETFARNFPDQHELIAKARQLLPVNPAILPAPWGESECSQLNIKRDGVVTGETLYYSIDPAMLAGAAMGTAQEVRSKPIPNYQSLRWELNTKKSNRSVLLNVDQSTGQANGQPTLKSNDYIGDPTAEPLAGPAIDIQQSVLAMRRMPLAVGYKNTLTTQPFTLATLLPREVELAVTGIESIEVTAGKFKCYKVSFNSLGQTFWFGVEGSRPLVKFKVGNVEAELVKMWGPENFIETELAFFREAGWEVQFGRVMPGPDRWASVEETPRGIRLDVLVRKIYTPPAEIPQALREALESEPTRACQPETIQTRVIGGQQAVSCVRPGSIKEFVVYSVMIRSGVASIELSLTTSPSGLAVTRWQIDRVLATAKRIP